MKKKYLLFIALLHITLLQAMQQAPGSHRLIGKQVPKQIVKKAQFDTDNQFSRGEIVVYKLHNTYTFVLFIDTIYTANSERHYLINTGISTDIVNEGVIGQLPGSPNPIACAALKQLEQQMESSE